MNEGRDLCAASARLAAAQARAALIGAKLTACQRDGVHVFAVSRWGFTRRFEGIDAAEALIQRMSPTTPMKAEVSA